MNGYSEVGSIYFMVGERTSFARQLDGEIVTGSYIGPPPFKPLKGKASYLLRQYHAAEHKVYNAFMKNIERLKRESSLSELSKHLPSLEEVKKTSSFSVFCGTTVFLTSALILILSAMPNIFRFHNQDIIFMSLWMLGTLVLSIATGMWIQKKYFLAEPNRQQLELALTALKEVFKNARTTK